MVIQTFLNYRSRANRTPREPSGWRYIRILPTLPLKRALFLSKKAAFCSRLRSNQELRCVDVDTVC